jgi:hypothetical protein
MEPESSLLCSQDTATGPYSEANQSSFPTYFRKNRFNIIPSTPRFSEWFFHSGFPTEILYSSPTVLCNTEWLWDCA